MKYGWMLMLAAMMAAVPLVPETLAELKLGVGANYWKAVDDIEIDDFDEDGLSWIASVQFGLAGISRIELAVEWFEEGFGGSTEEVYAPQVFFILGSGIYAGAGVGAYYVDGEFLDDPFFALRAGFNFELLPSVYLDINANYRFENWDQVNGDDISEDTIMLGAAARIGL